MIFEFIEEIVLLVHERPHLQYNMLPELCKFLKIISSCDIRPLKHTGVVFGNYWVLTCNLPQVYELFYL